MPCPSNNRARNMALRTHESSPLARKVNCGGALGARAWNGCAPAAINAQVAEDRNDESTSRGGSGIDGERDFRSSRRPRPERRSRAGHQGARGASAARRQGAGRQGAGCQNSRRQGSRSESAAGGCTRQRAHRRRRRPAHPADAASGGAAAASSRVPVTPGNVISDVVATRSFDSRAAFLNSPVATRVGQGAGSPETKLLADYQKDGRRCRDYQQTVLIAAQRVKAVGTVCQGGDGKWGLVPFQRPAQPTAGQGTSRAAADQ